MAALGPITQSAEGQNRTVDTRFFRPVLYQLSYLGSADQCTGHREPCPIDWSKALPTYNRKVARVIHVRIHGLHSSDRDALHDRFAHLGTCREWRDQTPWLAHSKSTDLFSQLFFAEAADVEQREQPHLGPLSAASFLRVIGDETDALALVFMLRDLSERFGVHVSVRDPDNPIAKLRSIDMTAGRLPDGRPLETILVRRPIFKRLRSGGRIEMYPPRALGAAFGTREGSDVERRSWSFLVHGMRDSRPSFLEAEAEAMRIWRGLRFLD